MILFKAGVRIKQLTPALLEILIHLNDVHNHSNIDYPKDWVITSINDSTHMTTSRHYKDEAVDIRSKNFSAKMNKDRWLIHMQRSLGPRFTVLLEDLDKENEHFHIQVKKGEVYP